MSIACMAPRRAKGAAGLPLRSRQWWAWINSYLVQAASTAAYNWHLWAYAVAAEASNAGDSTFDTYAGGRGTASRRKRLPWPVSILQVRRLCGFPQRPDRQTRRKHRTGPP